MNLCTEYFETGSKKGRGMAKQSLDLIDAMYAAAEKAEPITGRGIGYADPLVLLPWRTWTRILERRRP
jgi:hypothetical protein